MGYGRLIYVVVRIRLFAQIFDAVQKEVQKRRVKKRAAPLLEDAEHLILRQGFFVNPLGC